ncbi:prenyltransferase [Leucobacter allii]|uniref:Prenyltransferase n=1 Tax=Leucobacter allii TaxID=2932247 RepID=A0ABY4FL39_9MICO|nr:prenyltransferase [Leucobacter allii]UOQ56976.1 prenyltransferase [Leucobacter allii]UOR01446.1 prenyltransferase [Leucobacter allii]
MSYALLSAGFLVAALAAAVLLARAAGPRRPRWAAVAVAGVALLLLTAVFDSLMIGLDLFDYAPGLISGMRIGLAPVEDFAYPAAVAVALPALWAALTRRGGVPLGALLTQALVASRPVSWVNTAFPFAAAMLLTTREIDWLLVVGTLYYLVPYNLAMYGINDVFDYESDAKNPRKGGIEGALLAPEYHRPLLRLVLATNLPFLVLLLAAGGPAAWAAIAVSTFAVIAYSAPRLRGKERPVWDSIISSTHFVSPAVVGLALAGAPVDAGVIVLLAAFFLWGMAAHAFGAVQDIIPDREAGIGSIATSFGARRTVRLALALWLLAGLLVLAAPWPAPLAAVVAVPYLLNCAPWRSVPDADSARTNRAWRRFILLNYGSGFIVTLILILAWNSSA